MKEYERGQVARFRFTFRNKLQALEDPEAPFVSLSDDSETVIAEHDLVSDDKIGTGVYEWSWSVPVNQPTGVYTLSVSGTFADWPDPVSNQESFRIKRVIQET